MFATTFYSYKGGVGRTLALANVAIILARRGKRVLVVDFDLEAPGLTTLKAFEAAETTPGMVEFVGDYLESGQVPEISRYIGRCEIFDPLLDPNEPPLVVDVMPAGRLDDGYSTRFGAIDWPRLYREGNGFLLMEDLRSQWQAAGYDYVLIDSRTGLTDVGGICTRQLPDAVVAVYFPNEQNLAGLRQVVETIRTSGARPQPIQLIFAASRLPRLDDEFDVLRDWLARFQRELRYEERQLVRIEHYDSLTLLNQTLFALHRSTSGLGRQYARLCELVVQANVEDADGAIGYLRGITVRRLANAQASADTVADNDLTSRLDSISKLHAEDCVVQRALAIVQQRMRNIVEAAIATDRALASLGRTATTEPMPVDFEASLHALRIRLLGELGADEELAQSAVAVLRDPAASEVMTLDAIMALANTHPELLPSPEDLPALHGAEPGKLMTVAKRLSASPAATSIAAVIAEQAISSRRGRAEFEPMQAYTLQLILIAGARFAAAISLMEDASVGDAVDLVDFFNTTMAKWGRDGEPNMEAFAQIETMLAAESSSAGPNTLQCRALVQAVLGDAGAARGWAEEAISSIRVSGQMEFSCWNYLNVAPTEFEQHCRAIMAYASGDGPGPEFLRQDE